MSGIHWDPIAGGIMLGDDTSPEQELICELTRLLHEWENGVVHTYHEEDLAVRPLRNIIKSRETQVRRLLEKYNER